MKEWGSSRTRIEQFVESDLDARIDARVAPRHLKEDAINAARLTLSVCWFDAAACSEGLKALRSYRKEWDEEKAIWRDKPRHDSASHGADALQTLSVWWREMREEEPPEDLESRMRRQHAEHAKASKRDAQAKDLGRAFRGVGFRDGRGLSNGCLATEATRQHKLSLTPSVRAMSLKSNTALRTDARSR